jgi:basic membrane protein A
VIRKAQAITWLLALGVILTTLLLTGCGDDAEDGSSASPPADARTLDDQVPDLERELRVGLVTDSLGLTDHGLNALAHKGLQDAVAEIDVEATTLEAASAAEYLPKLEELAARGSDLVISVGPGMAAATHTAAMRHPKTRFAILDFEYPPGDRLPNVVSVLFNERESGYLVGFLAAMVSETGTIGVITVDGDPSAMLYEAGFAEGARAAQADIEVLTALAGSSDQGDACRQQVGEAVDEGADVVFPIGRVCADGALEVASERGIHAIGADVDRSYLGPFILTSAVKRADVAVLDTVHAVANGVVEDALGTMSPYRFRGGDMTIYGMSYGGIALAPISPDVDVEIIAALDEVSDAVLEGEIDLPRAVEAAP